jgi:hypothetical protein
MRALAEFDRQHNAGRIFKHLEEGAAPAARARWKLGGFDPRVGIWNPPYERPGRHLPGSRARPSCAWPRCCRARGVRLEDLLENGESARDLAHRGHRY